MNYYEHHLGDWAAATGHLTWDEDMAYTRLLRAYYHAERAILQGQQYRLAKASAPAQRKAVDAVLSEFFTLESDGCFHQKRADAEIAHFKDKQAKAKRSAETRWSAVHSQSERNANALQDSDANALRAQCEGNALQTPDTRHQTNTPHTPRKRGAATAPEKPEEVSGRVWGDWLTLRKAKRAPVTQTVLDSATAEAAKAGMTLEAFLIVWCRRGSQGLEAAWLKPEERGQPYESPRDRAARERMAQFAPGVAAKPPGFQQPAEVIDVAAFRVG